MGCKCNGTLGNTGAPGCPMLIDISGKFIIVPRYDSTGTENFIDLTTDIDAAYVNARLNDADQSKRWYPTPGLLENVTPERADTIYQEFEGGNKGFIRKGIRSVTALVPNIDPRLNERLDEFKCVQIAIYLVGLDGSLTGSKRDGETSTKLYPIIVSPSSFDSTFMFKTNAAVQAAMIRFDWSNIEKDGDLYMIPAEDITGISLLSINGLFDVYGSVSSITTTGLTLTMKTAYETPVTGLVIGDFFDAVGGTASRIYNVTDAAAVTLTSVTETPAGSGVYVFVFPAQTSADVLRVTPVKTKFDFSHIPEIVITVP